MADHTLNAVKAAARALEEVVLPAVDPAHPLAREQANLVLKYLTLMERWWPYANDRNRFELKHYLALAVDLLDDARSLSAAIAEDLKNAIDEARSLLEVNGSGLSEMQVKSHQLAGIISALARTSADAEPELRRRIEIVVLSRSKRLLDAQRAWFLPQGWERDQSGVPSIDKAFKF